MGKYCSKCGEEIDEDDDYCSGCGKELPKKSGGCFIATACYGENSEEVRIFRNWRDTKLLKSRKGRRFVNFYYKTSPSIAKFIFDKPLIKKIVKVGLSPIKEIIKE